MNHADLVQRADKWLRNQLNCRVVLLEKRAATSGGERPDAIGWVGINSIVVECKASRRDYYADGNKLSRRMPQYALGNWRFYLTEPGLLDGIELPEGWGWYEVHGRSVRHAGGAGYGSVVKAPFQSYHKDEVTLLVSALAELRGLDAGR